MENRSHAIELIKGAYDLHIHPYPSHVKRALNDFQLMDEADKVGLGGVLIKNHYEPTGARALLMNYSKKYKTKAYGGIVLNWPVGGLNPYALESSLNLGASIVWMPTRDAYNCLLHGDMEGDFFKRPGIKILNEKDQLLPAVYDIFDIVSKYGVPLATGHISAKESIILCKEGRKRNIKMVLTHPEWERTYMPLEKQKELAEIGVKIEKCWYNIAESNCTVEHMIRTIREIGTENIYISTDRGQVERKKPIEEFINFVEVLLKNNFKEEDIKNLICNVPKFLIKN
ncbi:DUF6282 family protein [Fusobacterium sp.]|uniref:DUF6282 family protein n=1 Tax=Fusobacterium sp. TaxID=68766 RepID=UPI0029038F1E|nr:DUF6282 family protein [Fusobacterium sp.]MDU1910936.1 DUF6282 family protein [Fusobacterium sp.]